MGQLLGVLLGQILTGQAPGWLSGLFDFFRNLSRAAPASGASERRTPRVFEWREHMGPWVDTRRMELPHLSELAARGDRWAAETLDRISESQSRMDRIDALLAELGQNIAEMEAAAKAAESPAKPESPEVPDVDREGW